LKKYIYENDFFVVFLKKTNNVIKIRTNFSRYIFNYARILYCK
jgi:hypothetical protein